MFSGDGWTTLEGMSLIPSLSKPLTTPGLQKWSGVLLAALFFSPACLVLNSTCLAAADNKQEGVEVLTTMADGFVELSAVIPGIKIDPRYFGSDNFLGAPVEGYNAAKVILSEAAAKALATVHAQLSEFGLGLMVFDGYRPQRAVDHFVRWARDLDDTKMKQRYYPRVEKKNLFSEGYIAERSGHSRGSTVDLTVIDKATGQQLDMGTSWDFFDLRSWPSSTEPNSQQRANRLLLQSAMMKGGFRPLTEEWWHFTLEDEPFPDTYFDFIID